MSGFDRAIMIRQLKKLGWKEVNGDNLAPPDELWENKPKMFYVYDARNLQDLLGESINE